MRNFFNIVVKMMAFTILSLAMGCQITNIKLQNQILEMAEKIDSDQASFDDFKKVFDDLTSQDIDALAKNGFDTVDSLFAKLINGTPSRKKAEALRLFLGSLEPQTTKRLLESKNSESRTALKHLWSEKERGLIGDLPEGNMFVLAVLLEHGEDPGQLAFAPDYTDVDRESFRDMLSFIVPQKRAEVFERLEYEDEGSNRWFKRTVIGDWLADLFNNTDSALKKTISDICKSIYQHATPAQRTAFVSQLLEGSLGNNLHIMSIIGADDPCGIAQGLDTDVYEIPFGKASAETGSFLFVLAKNRIALIASKGEKFMKDDIKAAAKLVKDHLQGRYVDHVTKKRFGKNNRTIQQVVLSQFNADYKDLLHLP